VCEERLKCVPNAAAAVAVLVALLVAVLVAVLVVVLDIILVVAAAVGVTTGHILATNYGHAHNHQPCYDNEPRGSGKKPRFLATIVQSWHVILTEIIYVRRCQAFHCLKDSTNEVLITTTSRNEEDHNTRAKMDAVRISRSSRVSVKKATWWLGAKCAQTPLPSFSATLRVCGVGAWLR
jgi:hypothetical protein